jgi:hypothetical protein
MTNLSTFLPQEVYKNWTGEASNWVSNSFKKSLNTAELSRIDFLKNNKPTMPSRPEDIPAYKAESNEREMYARKLLTDMVAQTHKDSGVIKAGVTTGLGFNFYDLRAPVLLSFPVNVPIRNELPRISRVNDGVGTAAHWMTNKNPGITYGGAAEGQRVQRGTPDNNPYVATYKEFGVERGVTFTAQFAGEGFADNLADEHLRGLYSLWLQEEGAMLNGNSGTGAGNNGFALGTCPTPTTALVATRSDGAAGNSTTGALPYTAALVATTNYVSVACVALTAMGNPVNSQYGYGVFPTIAAGLSPTYSRPNEDGTSTTVNGGISAISALSTPLQITTGNLSVKASIPAASLPIKGAFGYAWFVDVETSNTSVLGNAKLAGITSYPWCYINGTATGTQAGTATGLSTDHSFNTLDFDGLLTYTITSGGYYADLQGGSFTSQKNGRVTEVEIALQYIFTQFQTGIDTIWGSPDAVENLDAAIRYNGTTASGFQFIYSRDSQNNLLGGFVVSGYQSRFAVNNPTGANIIPIKIHPMVPAGTLYFDISSIPYKHSRAKFSRGMLVQREYYAIEWPVTTRQWTFGTYVHEVLAHNFPWISGIITGIGPFVGS